MLVQTGLKPLDSKPLTGISSGVFEIVTRYDGETYRTVYAVKIGQHVYVLHVFQK
jgi:phage-related protein